jgi:ABC-type arginine transport system permease subunit
MMDNTTSGQSVAIEKPAIEHREAYGTAKTENLRDNGLWRIILPAFVVACCLILLSFPLIILTPLFFNSLNSAAAANVAHTPLTWIWITMVIIEAAIIAIVIRGLIKIFMTTSGSYRSK